MELGDRMSRNLYLQASSVIPLGVNSNARYWGEQDVLYIQGGKGAHIWDVDGNQYIDYRLAFGPMILGYAYQAVDRRVKEAIERGLGCGLTTELEVEVAGKISLMCPNVEAVRLVGSGTEGIMHSLRLARAYTGREKVVKFEGGYHGGVDYLLYSTYADPETYGPRDRPIAVPASRGIPRCLEELVLTVPFNDSLALERLLQEKGSEIAAVVTEPMLGNFGCVDPEPGFLEYIRSACDDYGILMILDEVKTGFRVALGGAQEVLGVNADLVVYAKAMGNGYPIAAYGGRKEVMDLLGEGVAQGGTYAGNVVSAAAADATLEEMRSRPVHESINRWGTVLQTGLKDIFGRAGVPVSVSSYPSIFSLTFSKGRPSDARSWAKSNRDYCTRLARKLRQLGVLLDPDPREPWCLSYSHTDEDIQATLQSVEDAVKQLGVPSSI